MPGVGGFAGSGRKGLFRHRITQASRPAASLLARRGMLTRPSRTLVTDMEALVMKAPGRSTLQSPSWMDQTMDMTARSSRRNRGSGTATMGPTGEAPISGGAGRIMTPPHMHVGTGETWMLPADIRGPITTGTHPRTTVTTRGPTMTLI